MSNPISLPVILVSAKTSGAASKLISEIINEEESNGVESKESGEREWVIDNKYYTARVAFRPVGDDDSDFGEDVEAHVVLLDVGETVEDGERRVARAPHVELAVAALEADHVSSAVVAWAAAARLEPVELRPRSESPPPVDDERPPFGCERGVRRVREALHAHVWPGLRRHGVHTPHDTPTEDPVDDLGEEQLERFAAAVAALDAASRLSPTERRAQADALMVTLSRALRIPFDDL